MIKTIFCGLAVLAVVAGVIAIVMGGIAALNCALDHWSIIDQRILFGILFAVFIILLSYPLGLLVRGE
jgi:hypothetical protein